MMTGFVYCWTDVKTNMLYVGVHKGDIDDGYVCSSKWMKEQYKERPNDFSRQIIATGDISDMRKLESSILQSSGARLSEGFYNRHDNDGFFFEGWKTGEMSDSHRKKMSEAKLGKKLNKEHAEKLKASRVGAKNSPEHIEALRQSRIGYKASDETKKLMSETRKSHPKAKEMASAAGKASILARPENYKEIQSTRMKLWWADRKKKIGG